MPERISDGKSRNMGEIMEQNQAKTKNKKWIKRTLVALGIILIIFITVGSLKNLSGNLKETMDLRKEWSNGKCEGGGMVKFSTLPMRPEDFTLYLPYGLMQGTHVTPVDHGYFSPTNYFAPRDTNEVIAIGDGNIVQISTKTAQRNIENGRAAPEIFYRMDIEHNCTVYSYVDLLSSLAPGIKEKFDKSGKEIYKTRIPIKEGEIIGRIGGLTLDFAVYNNDINLDFINPKQYIVEPWKVHTDDPLKYFEGEAKSTLISKLVRTTEPMAGKINYDIDGKLIGNWFQEGTMGYRGTNQQKYWDGHLAIAYDYIDPSTIIFSTGNFNGKEEQFGIKENGPDPASIDIFSGIIKYELMSIGYKNRATNRGWNTLELIKDPILKPWGEVKGTALIQMLEDRKLKVEVFPGKTANQVSAFTSNARIYER